MRWGTPRPFAHNADYDDPISRFADYNAGLFASRNAAFQTQLAEMTALDLTPDGDLMRWTTGGKPRDGRTLDAQMAWRALSAADLPERRVRRDARLEKMAGFEQTATWHGVRNSYREATSTEPAAARIPDIAFDSPKITRDWTTRGFAESVQRRYRACLARS